MEPMTSSRGLPILVPDPVGTAGTLLAALREAELTVDHSPFVELRAQRDGDVRRARQRLAAGEVALLLLTTPLDAEVLLADPTAPLPEGTAIAAAGEDAATAVTELGLAVSHHLPEPLEALLAALPAPAEPGAAALVAGSAALDPALARALTAAGWSVEVVATHRPRSVHLDAQVVRDLRLHGYGAVVLTEPLLADLVGSLGVHRDIRVISRDPATTRAAEARGLVVHAEATTPDAAGLTAAVRTALDDQNAPG